MVPVFFYSFILTAVLLPLGVNSSWDKWDIIACAFPISFNYFWYATAYFALFFFMPLLNKGLFALSVEASKKTFLVFVIMFSVMSYYVDSFATQWGYSAIWLIVLYCLGVLAKRIELFKNKGTLTLIIVWAISTLFAWGMYMFEDIDDLIIYTSLPILLNGLIMLVVFSRFIFKGKIISKLSPLAFGIYLFHSNGVIWDEILKDALICAAYELIVLGVLWVLAVAFLVFATGLVVEFLRSKLAVWLR